MDMRKTSILRQEEGISLGFRDICFSVKEGQGMLGLNKERKQILLHASGIVLPGQCCAILGSSGSGKTSLLDIIARNNVSKDVSGQILIGGHELDAKQMREHCGYVMQDDSHLVELTVRETLTYSALLRLPATMSRAEKLSRVDQVISDLGLLNVADTKVGGGYVRGVSGGERRRVSIGVHLLKDPAILLLDEPTTGLDAFTANNIVATLSRLAKRNKTVIFTIHQPRSDIFPLLDVVMLLSQGQTAYFGSREEIINYFAATGFPCDIYSNPLDYYIDVVSIDKRSETRQQQTTERLGKLLEWYHTSQVYQSVINSLDDAERTPVNNHIIHRIRQKPSFLSHMRILTSRMSANLYRSLSELWDRLTQPLLFAFLIWLFLFRLGHDQSSVQNRSGVMYEFVSGPIFISMIHSIASFPALRNLYYRESIDSLYSPTVFILSYFVHLIPSMLLSNLLFSGFGYWAIGLQPYFTRFLIFMLAVATLNIAGEGLGLMSLGVLFNPNLANSFSALVLSVSALVGTGFLRSAQTLPVIFQRLSYISPFRYGSEILYVNEFSGLELTCPQYLPCDYPTGDDYLDTMYPGAEDRMLINFGALFIIDLVVILGAIVIFKLNIKPLR